MSENKKESIEVARQCSKCGGEMIQGFVLDLAGEGGGVFVSSWAPGAPKTSVLKLFWGLIQQPTGIKTQERIPIGTFRCSVCGFLESYAAAEFAVESEQ